MNNIESQIKTFSHRYFPEVVAMRRHLHQHPELSKEEKETASFIAATLTEYGISCRTGVAGFGVVGMIRGTGKGSRCIALRAELDALPVEEQNSAEYKSRVPGKMHACGHDAHMACLLGTARILSEMKDQFGGSVKLIFQPSEETCPGGAEEMIREGVLADPEVELVLAQHVFPLLDAGKVGFTPGAAMASTDEIYLTVRGKGGHAAVPHQVVDPILISAHILTALQQIVSRNADPMNPTVLSFGRITGEGRTNVIPNEVRIEGTVRTYDDVWRKEIHRRIETLASSVAVGMGGSCEIRIVEGYPALFNNVQLTTTLNRLAGEYLGKDCVVPLEKRMTAEDFSWFARRVPSCLYRLGIRNEPEGITSGLHSPTFELDEAALETGTGLMVWFAINLLGNE